MSLETASFIKDLVATNPLGTDPKSQGDDHLRMIKAVLKSQFSGFTQGAAITLTESRLNALGNSGAGAAAVYFDNPDLIPAVSGFFLCLSPTGAIPTLGGSGDSVLQIVAGSGVKTQLWQRLDGAALYIRGWTGAAWSAWRPVFEAQLRQNYAFGAGFSSSNNAAYRRFGQVAFLEGIIAKSSPLVSGDTVASLPVGYRPEAVQAVTVMAVAANLATQVATMEIRPSGQITPTAVIASTGTPSGVTTFSLAHSYVAALT